MKSYYVMSVVDDKFRRFGLNQADIQNAIQNGWSNTPVEFDCAADAKLYIRNRGGCIERREENGSAVIYIEAPLPDSISEKRAAAGRRRQELYPREATAQIRVPKSAVDAMRNHKIKDRPRFVGEAIDRYIAHLNPTDKA